TPLSPETVLPHLFLYNASKLSINQSFLCLCEQAGKGEPHIFKEKTFKKKRQCGVCRQNIDNVGSFCRGKCCKHERVRCCSFQLYLCFILQGSTKSLTCTKQRNTLPRSFSVDRVMERVMERHYDFDLTYITERIISVFFPPKLEEQRYRINLKEVAAMLKSKHQDKFLVREQKTVVDFLCGICWSSGFTSLLTCLLHNRQKRQYGNKGKTGVIIAAYMHYSKISAGADQALSTLAMRKFCEDKVSSSLQPSQNRYIYYFGGLLSGAIKMNSSPLFLHQVLIPSLPNFEGEGGYYPFLKIYQAMQLVYTSGIYDLQGSGGRRLCVTIEPALLLKGDIMVKCYHRQAHNADRDTVFRLQFHTCTIHGSQLWFGKGELDEACTDERFPSDATVEFVFSSGPEKIKGREYQKNDPAVTVDYNTADPVVRWDSYENFNQQYQDSLEDIAHTRGPLDGSLYAQIKKRRGPAILAEDRPDHLIAQGSDSALSGHSMHLIQSSIHHDRQEEPLRPPPPTRQEREELERLLGGIEGNRDGERETAILDDGDSLPSEQSGTLRLSRSCSCREGYRSQRCAEPGCDRTLLMPNGYCLDRAPGTNGHHGATPGGSNLVAPPSHMDLCQHYSPHPHQSLPPPDLVWDRQSDGLRSSGESVGWRDHITHGSFKRAHRDGHATCSTPSDMSGPPTPVHTSSPLRTQERYFILTLLLGKRVLCVENLHPSSYSNYSTVSIPLPYPQPPLPEKRHLPAQSGSPSEAVGTLRPAVGYVPPSNTSPTQHQHHVTFSPTVGEIAPPAGQNDEVASVESGNANRVSVKFVQDSSRFWYKPAISREQAIAALKEREPGTFLIRDSNSFQGAYGLALKVATPPPNVNNHNSKVSDPLEQLVRHFLIETGPRGVKIKGCQNEPYFGSLSALVYQHAITPISLPCTLKIPEKDLIGEVQEIQPVTNISTAADLLKQGAACNVLYLNSVETESLTGPQAIAKATDATLGHNPRPAATVVQFKVTSQGITLTDSQRRVFFRRHYPVNSVTFSSIDPKDRRWTNSDNTTVKVFGFVAKKPGSLAENVCHLFAELDPDQPASAIVNFINKVMLSQRR
uniref:Tensin 2a n=1 Tax=Anabas testudineus TaxID=64144 RepID=A0A7N6BF23_ANATE